MKEKKKHNKRLVNLIVICALIISGFAFATSISADNNKKNSEVSVELNIEKIDRDTVKIELDNFNPVIKSLQLSVAIDGNVKFEEDSLKWLSSSDSNDVKTHMKISDDKKVMDIFIVSTEALDKIGGKIEICEIDVAKTGGGGSAYSIDANVNSDGIAYSYIINDTNKQVSGIDMANVSENKLTLNSVPVISLKKSNSIVDGNIVVSKGDVFDAKNYIEVNDEEDGDIPVDKVTVKGNVNTNIVGSYSIEYTIADSEGDSTTLVQTVIVEDIVEEVVNNPEIIVDKNVINASGDEIRVLVSEYTNLFDFVTAVDYLGRTIDVEIIGEYDLAKAGKYDLTLKATDRLGNITEKNITLVVSIKLTELEPSDPIINNAPQIVANDITIKVGDTFNVLENVTASDKEDGDLTSKIEVIENNVDTTKAGKYKVTYSVEDSKGAKTTKTINVTVNIKWTELEPSDPIDPEGGNSGDLGNGGNGGSNIVDPEKPEVPDDNKTPGSSDGSNDLSDKNENDLPQTGQGVFYGVIIALAAVIIGAGILMLIKKKK